METVALSVIPDTTFPVVYASQYDNGRVQRFMLYDGSRPYTLSGDEAIELRIRKPNNQTETIEIENSGDDYIDLTLTDQITDIAGDVYCKFSIDDISTKGFYIKVEPGPARIYTGYADGEIVEFETDLVENLIILNVELSPSQDFNGYTKAWAGGCGKNIACLSSDTLVEARHAIIDYTDCNNIEVSVDGTYASAKYRIACSIGVNVALSFKGYCTANYKRVQISANDGWGSPTYGSFVLTGTEETKSLTFTTTGEYIYLVFYPGTANTPGSMVIKDFMIEYSSSATIFEPYSNVCSITGHSTVKIFRNGENPVDDSMEITVNFGQTIYQGIYLHTENRIKITHVLFEKAVSDMNNSESYPGWKNCGIGDLVEPDTQKVFNNAMVSVGSAYAYNTVGNNDVLFLPQNKYNGLTQTEWQELNPDLTIQFLIELAEPFYINLVDPATPIPTLVGTNIVYSDSGPVEVAYHKSTPDGGDNE